MDTIIKKVLKKIENDGFEAYVVGGYVRDLLLNKKSYDVDICTNALPKELNKIFPKCSNNNYGGITFKIKKYNFDITTYRKEIKYENRKPIEIQYINNLLEDIMRRDFTINAVCLNSKGYIIDVLEGVKDIKNGILKSVGDADNKFKEDPLRILRAIRFMSVLDFTLEDEVVKAIISNRDLILTLSHQRIKEEFDKILVNKNAKKGLESLKSFGILNFLNMEYEDIKYVNDPLGMWAQIKMEFNSSFTKEEKNTIINIRKILETKTIDKETLFNYGLYQSLVAGEILGIGKVYINKLYKQMPIHNVEDIEITSEDIMSILEISPSEILKIIIKDITNAILNKKVRNNYNDIRKLLLDEKEKWIK